MSTRKITDAPADECLNDPWELCTYTEAGCGTQCVNAYILPTYGLSKTNHHRNADLNSYYVEDHYPLANYDLRLYLTANAPCHEDGNGLHQATALGFSPNNVQNERNFSWALNCPENYGDEYSRGDLLNIRVIQHEITHLFDVGHCVAERDAPCLMTNGNSYNFDKNEEMIVNLWCSECTENFKRMMLSN